VPEVPEATASTSATDATAPTAKPKISGTVGVPVATAMMLKEAVIATEYP
jgi:hypothetical protein